jgi:hypothetical protein
MRMVTDTAQRGRRTVLPRKYRMVAAFLIEQGTQHPVIPADTTRADAIALLVL